MKNTKRLLAILLSATLLITTCSVGLLVTASDVGYSVEYRNENNQATFTLSDEDYAALGKNLISGKKATPYLPADDGLSHTAITNLDNSATKLAMLTDGAVEDSGSGASRAQLFRIGGGALPKLDLEYDLGKICNVDKFALISMQNTRDFSYYEKFYTGKYEVYLSNNKDELYNLENRIYFYDYTTFDKRSGAQIVTFDRTLRGRYLAVRILDPVSLNDGETATAYARIAEIGLFGDESFTVTHRREDHNGTDLISDEQFAELGTNLIKNELPTAYIPNDDYSNRNQVDFSTMNGGSAEFLKMTDGTVSNNGGSACWAQLRKNGSGDERLVSKIDLEYDLGYYSNIDEFILVSVQDQSTKASDVEWHAKKYLGEYEVYISAYKSDLYNPENLVYSYNYKNEEKRSGAQKVSFKNSVSGRYVAIRIKNPLSLNEGESDTAWPRISEIGVFGEALYNVKNRIKITASDDNTDLTTTYSLTNDEYDAIGTNLLTSAVPSAFVPNTDGTGLEAANLDTSNGNPFDLVTDGVVVDNGTGSSRASFNKPYTTDERGISELYLQYDLGEKCSISDFVLVSCQNPRDFSYYQRFYTAKYEVYLSDSPDNLYSKTNLIYSYDYKDLEDATKPSGMQHVTFKDALEGQYLAIRITNPVVDNSISIKNTHPRIAEIGVFGTKQSDSDDSDLENKEPVITYTDSDYAALGNNLLSGSIATPYVPDSNGGYKAVANLDNQRDKLSMLTDGKALDDGTDSTWAKLYYQGGASSGNIEELSLEYDLGTVCDVDKFVFVSIQNIADQEWHEVRYIGKYEVYLADKKEDLYKSENLIYAYNYKNEEAPTAVQTVNFSEKLKGRYLAVRILDPVSMEHAAGSHIYPRIAEIGLFGQTQVIKEVFTGGTVKYRTEANADEFTYTNESYAAFGKNLLSGKIAKTYLPSDDLLTHTEISNLDNKNAKLSMLTDGIVVDDGNDSSWSKLYYQGGAASGNIEMLDIEYDLGTKCDVDKFVFVSIQNIKDFPWHQDRYIGQYEVYLSDNQNDLYNKENRIYFYDYRNETEVSGVQEVTFNETLKGRYLAVRILDPVSMEHAAGAHIYPRIAEIGLFGEDFIVKEEFTDGTVKYRTEENQYTFNYTNDDYAALGTNLIKGKEAKPYLPSENGKTHTLISNLDSATEKLSMLTDGIVVDDGNNSSWAKLFYHGGKDSGNIEKLDLEYDLGGECSVEKFVFVGIQNLRDFDWNSERYIGKYEVYLSNNREDLYEKSNRIYFYDYKNQNKPSGIQEVTFNKTLKGRYLAVRILDPVSMEHEDGAHIYPRIAEIGVFGDNGLDYNVTMLSESLMSDMFTNAEYAQIGNNLLSGRVAAPYARDKATNERKYILGNENKSENLNGGTETVEKLTDGLVYDGTGNLTAGFYYHGGEAINAIDFEYNLGSVCKIQKFALLGSSIIYEDNLSFSKSRYTGAYEVYLSNDKENLYAAENMIYSYDYERDGTARGQIVEFDELKVGQYLAVRINNPVTTAAEHVYARISEIGLFGEDGRNYSVEYISEPVDGPVMTNQEFAAIGNNIINGATPRLLLNGVANSTLTWQNSGNILNDGDLSQSTNFRWVAGANGECYVDIIYEFGEDPIDFEKFAFIGYKNPWKHYYTGHYAVYVAMEYDELFLEETLAYEYDRTVDQVARGQIVTFKNKPRGCYLAVRILDPNMLEFDHNDEDHLWIAPKISEIGAYGTKAVIIPNPTNLAENMPVEAYLTDKNGNLSKLEDDKFSAADVKKLTDGNYDSNTVFESGGKDVTLVYNLCKDMKIDKIRLRSADSNNKPNSVKVYASTDYNAIWNEKSLIYSGEYNEAEIGVGKDIRYARIVVSGRKSTLGISEIEIIGMDNQKLKYKNLARSINSSNIQFFAQNNKTGFVSYLDIDSSVAKGLVDNDKNTVATVEGGNPQKESLNVQMYLGDLKTIDSVSLYFKNKTAYQPKKAYIYICQSEEESLRNDLEPIAVVEGLPTNNVYNINFNPTLGRYLRICIPESNPEQVDYDTYCIGFTEISIMGTAVVGTQTDMDNDALLSYTNKNYNISWDVIRIDTNDITTKIASSRIVRTTATNAQKESLNTAMYKIVGDSVYEIQFFDITGKRVYDIDGRLVRIKTSVSGELLGGQVLFGNAADKDVIELYETLENDENTKKPYIYYDLNESDGYKFVITQLTDLDDPYWDFMEDEDSDNLSGDDTESDDSNVDKNDLNDKFPILPIVIIGTAVILVAAAVISIIIIKKRRK